MPRKYPPEFKRDVVAVARRSHESKESIAADFGISVTTLKRWSKQADVDDGVVEGASTAEQQELVALRRRARLLEQENEILRRAAAYFAEGALPK